MSDNLPALTPFLEEDEDQYESEYEDSGDEEIIQDFGPSEEVEEVGTPTPGAGTTPGRNNWAEDYEEELPQNRDTYWTETVLREEGDAAFHIKSPWEIYATTWNLTDAEVVEAARKLIAEGQRVLRMLDPEADVETQFRVQTPRTADGKPFAFSYIFISNLRLARVIMGFTLDGRLKDPQSLMQPIRISLIAGRTPKQAREIINEAEKIRDGITEHTVQLFSYFDASGTFTLHPLPGTAKPHTNPEVNPYVIRSFPIELPAWVTKELLEREYGMLWVHSRPNIAITGKPGEKKVIYFNFPNRDPNDHDALFAFHMCRVMKLANPATGEQLVVIMSQEKRAGAALRSPTSSGAYAAPRGRGAAASSSYSRGSAAPRGPSSYSRAPAPPRPFVPVAPRGRGDGSAAASSSRDDAARQVDEDGFSTRGGRGGRGGRGRR